MMGMDVGFQEVHRNDPISKRFEALAHRIKLCNKCDGLNIRGETESAPGFGNIKARIMIVGQSLCRKCMETQTPFSGGSGLLLDLALKKGGLSKTDVFVTNAVHCHTPGNRKSLPHEIANCRPYLNEEVEIVRPKAIIALGRDAVMSFLDQASWPKDIGKRVQSESFVVYPFYHPSYVRKLGRGKIERYVTLLGHVLQKEAHDTL
jgi:DNA polymerase